MSCQSKAQLFAQSLLFNITKTWFYFDPERGLLSSDLALFFFICIRKVKRTFWAMCLDTENTSIGSDNRPSYTFSLQNMLKMHAKMMQNVIPDPVKDLPLTFSLIPLAEVILQQQLNTQCYLQVPPAWDCYLLVGWGELWGLYNAKSISKGVEVVRSTQTNREAGEGLEGTDWPLALPLCWNSNIAIFLKTVLAAIAA